MKVALALATLPATLVEEFVPRLAPRNHDIPAPIGPPQFYQKRRCWSHAQRFEGGVAGTLKPEMTDAAFAQEAAMIRACVLPTRSCNGFIPASFRLTGPEPTHAAALKYAVKACRRGWHPLLS